MTDTGVFTYFTSVSGEFRAGNGEALDGQQQDREELRRVLPPGRCGLFWWYLGYGGGHTQITYPRKFKMLAAVTAALTIMWSVSFVMLVKPALAITSPAACKFADEQLRHSTKLLILYFTLVVIVRVGIFIPGVATRYVVFSPELHGPCYYYTAHMILHGPLYAFSCSVLLFWVQLMQSPDCVERNQEFYSALQWSATKAIFVALAFIALSVWHFRLLTRTIRVHREQKRKAPPGTMQRLATVAYDETLFGDEDGKRYPAECAICLDDLSNDEGGPIKVMPCDHVFHEACLRDWLETSRICALCRHDVTKPWPPPETPRASASSSPSGAQAETIGASTPQDSASTPRDALHPSSPHEPSSPATPPLPSEESNARERQGEAESTPGGDNAGDEHAGQRDGTIGSV